MLALKSIRLGLRSCNASSRDANNVLYKQGCRSLQSERESNVLADTIKIPYRIQRGPTDILKALSGTLSRDTTAPHFKYLDDPYLSPMSNAGKRNFAMAKESGRKAAKWIRAEHSQVFETAGEKPKLNEDDEAALNRAIDGFDVDQALSIFQRKQEAKLPLSETNKLELLQLLCFHNAEQPLPEDLIEERWFRQSSRGHERERKTWKDGGAAETVFSSLSAPTAAAHSAMVAGMARFGQAERASQAQAAAGDVTLATPAYDGLIRAAAFLAESPDLRWKMVTELLTEMSSRGVRPTVLTLNAVLETLASMRHHRPARSLAHLALTEFQRLGIEPSLASFYHLIVVYSRERTPSTLVMEIVAYLEGCSLTMRDPNDARFFAAAMEACRQQRDPKLAHRLHAVLLAGDNQSLVGDSHRESVYYRHYFALVCSSEPLDSFMTFYNQLVPNVYTPEPGVMEEVLRALEANGAAELYPRFWTDMRTFDHADRENLVAALMAGMVHTQRLEDEALAQQFGEVAGQVWERLEAPREGRYNKLEWSGSMLGDVLTLFARAGALDRAAQALTRLASVSGVPDFGAMEAALAAAIKAGHHELALSVVEFSAASGFPEAGRLGAVLAASLPLDAARFSRLETALGSDAISGAVDKKAAAAGVSNEPAPPPSP